VLPTKRPEVHYRVIYIYSAKPRLNKTVRFKEVSGLSSFKNFWNQTTGCGDIAYCQVRYFILSHPGQKERSVAFKRRQNPFLTGALPWTPAGGPHNTPPDPLVGWGGYTPPHTSSHSAYRPTFGARHASPQNSSQIYGYAYMHATIFWCCSS